MANITISDLTSSVDSESFFTDLSELNEQDMASIMGNIIGGWCCCWCCWRRPIRPTRPTGPIRPTRTVELELEP